MLLCCDGCGQYIFSDDDEEHFCLKPPVFLVVPVAASSWHCTGCGSYHPTSLTTCPAVAPMPQRVFFSPCHRCQTTLGCTGH